MTTNVPHTSILLFTAIQQARSNKSVFTIQDIPTVETDSPFTWINLTAGGTIVANSRLIAVMKTVGLLLYYMRKMENLL